MKHTLDFLLQHGYAVLFVSVLIEQLGLPVPSIPILLAVGALAGRGDLAYVPALLTAVAACLIADNVWYWLGVYRGASILNLLCKISLEPDSCVRNTENMFLKYGPRGLLFSKFVPGLSTAACPLAGMFRMEIWKFCVFDGLGSIIWAGSYSLLGYIFADRLEALAESALGMGSVALGNRCDFRRLPGSSGSIFPRRKFYKELRKCRAHHAFRAIRAVDERRGTDDGRCTQRSRMEDRRRGQASRRAAHVVRRIGREVA